VKNTYASHIPNTRPAEPLSGLYCPQKKNQKKKKKNLLSFVQLRIFVDDISYKSMNSNFIEKPLKMIL